MSTIKKEEDTDDEHIECVGVIPTSTNGSSPARSRKLRDQDVLFVHGEATLPLDHPGVAAYQKLIRLNRVLFANADGMKDKLQIAKSIVAQIRKDKGRFLERENGSGIITSLDTVKWKDVIDRKATEITLKALGDEEGQQFSSLAPTPPQPELAAVTKPHQQQSKRLILLYSSN